MFKKLKRQLMLSLVLFLIADLLAIYLTTTHPSSIPKHLQSRLTHKIEIVDQIRVNEMEFILYHDLATDQLDIAWYETNTLLFWRYNFSGGHTTSSGAYVNRCQTYQTSDYFLVWGINEDLRASTLKISLNNETFIEDLSQELYFIKVYPLNGEFPDTIYCSFYNKNHENISSYFFESFSQ